MLPYANVQFVNDEPGTVPTITVIAYVCDAMKYMNLSLGGS